MRIYLETNIWNNSLDQHVQPSLLLEKLDRAGCTPVLSLHVIFELLKTFRSNEPRAQDRGRRLFTQTWLSTLQPDYVVLRRTLLNVL